MGKTINPKPLKRLKKSVKKTDNGSPKRNHKRLSLPSGKSEKFYKQWISRERSLRNKERDAHEMTKNMLALVNLRSSEQKKIFESLNVILADLTFTVACDPSELPARAKKIELQLKDKSKN